MPLQGQVLVIKAGPTFENIVLLTIMKAYLLGPVFLTLKNHEIKLKNHEIKYFIS